MAPATQAEAQDRAGLHRLQPQDVRLDCAPRRSSPKRPSAARSSIWPPTMPPMPAARASPSTSAIRTAASGCVFGRPRMSKAKRQAGRRRRGWRSPRRTPCARSDGRAADRRRPSPADRRAPVNSSARIRSRRRPSARARVGRRTVPRSRPSGTVAAACRRRGWHGAWPRSAGADARFRRPRACRGGCGRARVRCRTPQHRAGLRTKRRGWFRFWWLYATSAELCLTPQQ